MPESKTVYQCDSAGYYVGQTQDYGGPMPHGCVAVAPPTVAGRIPRWAGGHWEQIENHVGEQGYVDGQPFTIDAYGPYPDGWSVDPPPPTPRQRAARLQAEIEVLERKGERPNREINLAKAAGQEAPAGAVKRLKEIDAAIVKLRLEMEALDV
ncbi:hypothetical protein LJB86_04930 [Deltaproteobacteria bacterium OttesenSCG-928-M10]|nr:hypothetical protein [Deltaproteobacteria bacterium OttesenSCG-928-M10]